ILTKSELLGETKPDENFHVRKYQEDIEWSQRIIIVHPVWWSNVPAMLKGYFDRVLSLDFAYEARKGKRKPMLGGRKGILVQIFDTEETVEIEKKLGREKENQCCAEEKDFWCKHLTRKKQWRSKSVKILHTKQ
ncbi:MAG: NAD(P)H-dependent oxidoreductase, partial [Candidatus Heimdallarchaeota archaeon]